MITKVGGFPVLKISKEEVKKRNLMVAGFNSSGYEENGNYSKILILCFSGWIFYKLC